MTTLPTIDRASALRCVALLADHSSIETQSLAPFWAELISGTRRVVDCFSTENRSFLVLSDADGTEVLRGRALETVERVLLGDQQKVIASDLNISPTTVTETTRAALGAMGLTCAASRAPLPLCLVVYANKHPEEQRVARVSHAEHDGVVLQIVTMPSPDGALVTKISPAETAVLKLQVEGKTHAEIARLRRSSARTIANQLASAGRKLGVSGRGELLRYLSQCAL